MFIVKLKALMVIQILMVATVLLAEPAPNWFREIVTDARSKHGLIVDNEIIDELYLAIVEISKKHDFDPLLVIALIKVEGAGFKPAELGDSDSLRVGEMVLAIGNPLGLAGEP
ncbi:MAG: hypothetical protein ACK40Q_08085, partial [Pseudothermotoga sp.]